MVIAAVFLAISPPLRGSTIDVHDPSPENARFLRFMAESGERGLSQNTVRAIVQDRYGFLWFGTEEGLNRYDGYSFFVYKHRANDARSLPDDLVTALYEDRAGRFWVGTRGALSLFDAGTNNFNVRLSVREEVMAVLEDRLGRLWVATAGDGLFRLDNEKAKPVHYATSSDDGSLAHDNVLALLEDKAGRIWVGTQGGGLDRFDPEKDGFVHYRHDPKNRNSLGADQVWGLAEDPSGRIWVATYGAGVSVLDPFRGTFRHYRSDPRDPKALQADLITTLYVDRRGTLWLGADPGPLQRYVPENDSFVAYRNNESPESISPGAIRAIHEDVQGNLWIGTFAAGLNWFRRNAHPFHLFTRRADDPQSLAGGGVASFLQDRDGGIWVGAEGSLNRFDPETGRFVGYPVGPHAILDIHQDRRGRIWLGTWGRGLLRFDPARQSFTEYLSAFDDPRTQGDEQVWSIDDDEQGWLWLSTNSGVFRLNPDDRRVVPYRPDPERPGSLSHEKVRALHRDKAGSLWVATLGGGLDMLPRDGTEFVHHRHDPKNPKSLSNDWVMALYTDRLGRLWIGTYGGGLNLFDPADKTFTAYGEAQGLPSNSVYSIQEDDGGKLWLGTNKGLCRFDYDKKRAETFDTTNGLQGLQFNINAALRMRAGGMLFGTWNGFYSFDPNRITPNPIVPPIVLTTLEVLNEPRATEVALPLAEEIKLHYDEKIISFEFAVLDYTFPRRNNYAYKLDGFNDDWVLRGTKRDVTFTNLDPGSYVLHVKGSNSDGVWDDKGRSLRIVIPPPFWKTWWFQGLASFAVVALVFSAHRYRIRLHEERERELELRIDEAMSKLKIMKGLLPICATCKKVRDDKGYWNQIESYIRTHSEADFSHGICPDCIVKYWGNTRAASAAKKRES